MRYLEILFPISIQIFYFIAINIWFKSYLKLLLDQVSDFSISWHVCHSFHIIYMYIIQGSIACSCFNLNEICWDWKILADISFFFFLVSPNLTEISSCVTWAITSVNQCRPYLSKYEVNDISINRSPVSYTWNKIDWKIEAYI